MEESLDDEIRIVRNSDADRYEVWLGDVLAGFAEYRESPSTVTFTHTQVYPAFSGRGLAQALARDALDDVVDRGKTIVPVCPFIAAYLRKRPEYQAAVRWPGGAA
ncbi:GNAT family N-acetyltransferase [Luethyella okanaganae]|uniref:GNAT family N-acetyltransferase n=1 Tax=Luethyella okanaganae TaxID=69372 RepID=A0ABW1VES2_9MICO